MMKLARLTAVLAAFAMAQGCRSDPSTPVTAITLIVSGEIAAPTTSIDAAIEVEGTDPAIVRLYHVPAKLAPLAMAEIDRAAGVLGRWAAGSRATWNYSELGHWERGTLRAVMPVERGDLILLAIEPVGTAGGARFAWRDAAIFSGAE